MSERDELFDDAVMIIFAHGKGSASVLQRRLRIGYGRASGLLDQMADARLITQGWETPPYAIVTDD